MRQIWYYIDMSGGFMKKITNGIALGFLLYVLGGYGLPLLKLCCQPHTDIEYTPEVLDQIHVGVTQKEHNEVKPVKAPDFI